MSKQSPPDLSFDLLVNAIRQVDAEMVAQAGRAVNLSLTLRNWMIGFHIEEYERGGVDRAEYGDKLMDTLAARLTQLGISRCDRREIYRYRQFYLIYPQIVETVTPQLQSLLGWRHSGVADSSPAVAAPTIVETSPQLRIDGKTLISRLSFSHIAELLNLEDSVKRTFYEMECIQGNWSVRELRRQIHSLYYERSGLSTNKQKLSELAQQGAERAVPALSVRDPYIFEFLGLTPQEVMSESHLEDNLINKIEAFLLELGHGFCFEARQKRILIGDGHYFIDLVFYHRILKCHVLVELKLAEFSHENIGQLNTYVSWYRKNMMTEGDNPPIGILLCTQKDHALVEYALAGIDNGVFVSKYLLELPKKEEMQRFIEAQLAAGNSAGGSEE